MTAVRCSALPRVLRCPPSARPPAVVLADESAEATLGSAVHGALAHVARHNLEAPPPLEEFCGDVVDEDDARPLVWAGVQFLREEDIGVVAVERELSLPLADNVVLTGHPDLVGTDEEGNLVIVDWKTSEYGDCWDQLRGYALLGRGLVEGAERARLLAVYLREREVDERVETWDSLEAWRAELVRVLRERAEVYAPGAHCLYCPRRRECPARAESLRSAAGTLLDRPMEGGALTRADLARLYDRAKLLRKALDEFDASLREDILANGPLPLDDGREVRLEPQTRERIDAAKALSVLPDALALAEAGVLSVSKPRLLQWAAAGAKRGEKGRAREEMMKRLREAGAVSETTSMRLAIRKREEEEDGPAQ